MKNVCFFNSEKKWGGGEKWHFKMAALFTKNNYNVTLVGSARGELVERAAKNHIIVEEISIKKHSYFNPIALYKIYRIFKEKKIDTLFMNSSQDLKLCSLPAKFAGIKNIVYRRGMPHPIKNTFLNRIIFSKVLTHLIVNSKEIEKSIFEAGAMSKMLDQNLTLKEIAQKITGDKDVKVIDASIEPKYNCGCSKEKFAGSLVTLGEKQLKELIEEDEKAEIKCQFCNKTYQFNKEELEEILKRAQNK